MTAPEKGYKIRIVKNIHQEKESFGNCPGIRTVKKSMRKYAYLKEPLKNSEGNDIVKIMLCESKEGFYLFKYGSLDAVQCSSDLCYESLEDLYEDWNDLIDERGWIEMEDPLPDCQQDAWIPLRVKGRDVGKPEWGKYETLKDGKWVEYKPEEQN